MRKPVIIGVRVTTELKTAIEGIANEEGRTVSQVSELLLKAGLEAYEKHGHLLLKHLASRAPASDRKKRT